MLTLSRPAILIAGLTLAIATMVHASGAGAAEADRWHLIHAGTLLAIPGEAPEAERTLVIRDGTIRRVAEGYLVPEDLDLPEQAQVTVHDLTDAFLLPGFIDAHVHITGQSGEGSRKLREVTQSDADIALAGALYARRTLMAGFTTVRDVGARDEAIFALRDAIAAGHVPGPRILASGHPITPTGGHGDTHGLRADILALFDNSAVCDGADDCRRAVRAQVKKGADVIKVTATGGVLSETDAGTGQQFTDAELAAIVETAHALGRKVAAHAHAKAGIEAALRAGVDSIEHAMWADDETFALFRRTGAWVVPTVYPMTYVGKTEEEIRRGPLRNLPPESMAKLIDIAGQPYVIIEKAIAHGVKVALGTDAAIYPHGQNAREFVEYVEAGMDPMDALAAGTVNAAELLGLSERLGTLEPGKAADIVGLAGNPLERIEAVTRVRFVMKDGVLYRFD